MNMIVNVEILEQVTQFSYFGYIITCDDTSETEANKRIGMAKRIFNKVYRILTSRQINSTLKMKPNTCFVYSTLLLYMVQKTKNLGSGYTEGWFEYYGNKQKQRSFKGWQLIKIVDEQNNKQANKINFGHIKRLI